MYQREHVKRLKLADRKAFLDQRRQERKGYRRPNTEARRAADQRRRARKRGVTVGKPFTETEIFKQDEGRCQLCGQDVDSSLSWPHPRSLSLDHRQPLTLGGEHSKSNVQLAHLACNLRKGAHLEMVG